ncbi:hypothetical protein SAMN05216548_10293 [Faunimonas pinastri]|uniref:AsmA-like C-terminal domain-containing protein n=1 Tax=Faunimonas pinastri TaxID=1855383 RepID=A0A1H9CA32_9HYPH|nr:hypothetical protein [Faunimonas pinastri]SEP98014.1 hypothetical protein SAMN05216548_10293 [Faunimonas pinastri]
MPQKLVLHALLLASVSGPVLMGTARADGQSEALVKGFIAAVGLSRDWSANAASVRSEGADTIAENVLISNGGQQFSVKIGRLRLRDLHAATGGGFAASEAELSGVQLRTPSEDEDVSSIKIASPLIGNLGAIRVDVSNPASLSGAAYEAMSKSSFGSLDVQSVTSTVKEKAQDSDQLTPTARMSMDSLHLDELKDGVIASFNSGPIRSDMQPAGKMPGWTLSGAALTGAHLDVGAAAHVYQPSAYVDGKGDAQWRTVLRQAAMKDVTSKRLDDDRFSAHLGNISLEDFQMRQPAKPFGADVGWLMNHRPNGPLDPNSVEHLANVTSAYRLGRMVLSDFAATDGTADAPVEATFDEVSFEGFDIDGLEAFALRDLKISSPEARGGLQSLQFGGLRLPPREYFKALLEAENAHDQPAITLAARKMVPGLERFHLDHFAFGTSPQKTMTLKALDVHATPGATFDAPASAEDVTLDTLVVPAELIRSDENAEILDALGYSQFVLDGTGKGTYEASAGRFDGSTTLTLKDAGAFTLSADLSGMTQQWFEAFEKVQARAGRDVESLAAQQAVLAAFGKLTLNGASVRVSDRSIVGRAFALAAEKKGQTGPEMQQQTVAALPFLLQSGLKNPGLVKTLTGPLQEFLGGGKTLVLTLAPKSPVPLEEVASAAQSDPQSIPQILNLQAASQANPPARTQP